MESSRVWEGERRHDLDALRAVAMLLGILLHAALAYVPAFPWVVQDTQTNGLFFLLFSSIHGFRMQVFFVMSGFFTALLWRKRGLRSLLANRFKRIFLPLLLGMFTVVPAVNLVSGLAIMRGMQGDKKESPADNVWAAAKQGDLQSLQAMISAGADLNELEKMTNLTALGWASFGGHKEAVELLLKSGAKPDVSGQSSTPLHAASLFGGMKRSPGF